ncbi:hypothetical protein RvY_08026 [Ramazzottius varieornatus]|uniref:Uncharacterized protein n=1 Tax=Ramazzottius varieornatus TaxID=947166 RepID=A0A1D1VDL5_RAMVA|nr:hypothetical protein RvY_08026 [Ramazzottius varieornatus]
MRNVFLSFADRRKFRKYLAKFMSEFQVQYSSTIAKLVVHRGHDRASKQERWVRDAEQRNADGHDNANDAEYAEQPRKLLFGNAYRGNGHAVHDAALAGHAATYHPRRL